MGIFKRTKTPPPPASEVSHDHTGAPAANTTQEPVIINHTGTTYTPTSEMPAPQYTQHDSINNAPPAANEAHYNEKSGALNSQSTGYTSDPNLLHNQQHQQVYPDPNAQQYSQSQIHVQHPPSHQQPDFHAQDKAQQAQQQQQQQAQPQNAPFHGGRNVYNVARPLHSLQGRSEVVDCPHCGVRELTRTQFTSGGTTHAAAALCCFCFCLGCIPYIGHWIKNCEHYCGNCNQLLAIWHRSGDTEVVQRRQGGPAPGGHQKPGGPGAAVPGQNNGVSYK